MVTMIDKECLECNIPITVRFADHKRGYGKFCSISCSSIYKAKIVRLKLNPNCVCAQCGKKFYRNKSKQALSKSGLQFCNRMCKDVAQRIGGIEAIQPDHYNGGSDPRYYRKLALRSYPNRCYRCGYDKYISVLEVHHKDRDRTNNKLSNLEILCRNCHGEEHRMDRLS